MIVHFENHLAHPTGIHWHGIELDNASDGTPLTQNKVPPGGTFLYKFKVTRPGIYWYHPHHHSSTNQVFKGLYGTIIVTDPNEATLQAPASCPPRRQTRTLALSDITVCKARARTARSAGHRCAVTAAARRGRRLPPARRLTTAPARSRAETSRTSSLPASSGTVNEGQTVLTNGKNVGGRAGAPDDNPLGALDAGAATLDVVAGQGLRLQIGNEATVRFFRLRLTGSDGTNTIRSRSFASAARAACSTTRVVEGGVVSGFDFKYDSRRDPARPGRSRRRRRRVPATATGVLTLWTKTSSAQGSGSRRTSRPSRWRTSTSSVGRRRLHDRRRHALLSSLGAAAKSRCSARRPATLLDPPRSRRPSPGWRTRTSSSRTRAAAHARDQRRASASTTSRATTRRCLAHRSGDMARPRATPSSATRWS